MYQTTTNPLLLEAMPARWPASRPSVAVDDPEAGLSSIDAIVMCAIVVAIVAVGVGTLRAPIAALFTGIANSLKI